MDGHTDAVLAGLPGRVHEDARAFAKAAHDEGLVIRAAASLVANGRHEDILQRQGVPLVRQVAHGVRGCLRIVYDKW